eukprot:6152749-Pyramimonas_sp.AAC.1
MEESGKQVQNARQVRNQQENAQVANRARSTKFRADSPPKGQKGGSPDCDKTVTCLTVSVKLQIHRSRAVSQPTRRAAQSEKKAAQSKIPRLGGGDGPMAKRPPKVRKRPK